jgi:hypothetical protein
MRQEASQETAPDFAAFAPEEDFLGKIPIGYARRHLILPCRETDGTLVILSGRPDATYALDEIRFLVGPARLVPAPEEVILKKIDAAYERRHTPEQEIVEGLSGEWTLDVEAAIEETRRSKRNSSCGTASTAFSTPW